MEENNKIQFVKSTTNKTKKVEAKKENKVSYEQLENIAHQLSEQNKQMYMKLQEINYSNMFKRLDYLFKVVEFGAKFNTEFVMNCIDEIEALITIPEESTEKENTKEENKE